MSVLYRLLSPTSLGEFSIVMRGEDEFGTRFFVHGEEVTPTPAGIEVDVDIDFRKFERIRPDYLQTTWGIPLFSKNFFDSAPAQLRDDIETIPAELHLRGGRSTYLAARTTKYLRLVDVDASKFSNIRGIRILTKPSFDPSAGDFLVARDREFTRVFVASESLVTAIKETNLRMEYWPY
ncbi:hypothetical protein F3087_07300 [Nocardia colli]|uniref:Uncharacterized protein n=1 Tax=Nocardia colli TaxID=2545717 RepID=A0A5N0EN25_9NOCA|nr:hypothetical protein [Nocardia colli]KAA8888811.1 hypothetical protein F3087_07300 [Nocardia colli]